MPCYFQISFIYHVSLETMNVDQLYATKYYCIARRQEHP